MFRGSLLRLTCICEIPVLGVVLRIRWSLSQAGFLRRKSYESSNRFNGNITIAQPLDFWNILVGLVGSWKIRKLSRSQLRMPPTTSYDMHDPFEYADVSSCIFRNPAIWRLRCYENAMTKWLMVCNWKCPSSENNPGTIDSLLWSEMLRQIGLNRLRP